MSELKLCPFCKGEIKTAVITFDEKFYEPPYEAWYLEHTDIVAAFEKHCPIPTTDTFYDTEAEAIDAWNTRAAMEFDNWFYLPKPREAIAEIAETLNSFDGEKWTVQQFFKVQEQAAINWAKELDENIIRRICEVWGRERTCRNVDEEYPYFECSECGCHSVVGYGGSGSGLPSYCPNCGAKVIP